MKKFLLYTAITLGVLLLAVYLVGTFFLGDIVKRSINREGPELTQTRTVLEGATISPFSGTGTLTGFTVENPPGWSQGSALHVGKIYFSVQPTSLFTDHIVVNDITIDQAEFLYETKLVASNINDLLKNIESAGGSKKAPDANPAKSSKKIEVKHFLLTNGKVTLGVAGQQVPVSMPKIELSDLGQGGNGITAKQLSIALTKSITTALVEAAAKSPAKLGLGAGSTAIDTVKKTGEELKKLFQK